MLIGGKLCGAASGALLDSVDPATEEVVGRVPDATAEDVDTAVASAVDAADAWRDTSWTARGDALRRLADVVEEHRDELAMLDTVDGGNPYTSMRADVASAARELRYFAGLGGETKGRTIPSGPDAMTWTEFVPYPVVGRIVPFNHPLKFAIGKAAAPLAAGCAVIVKPGEETSLSALQSIPRGEEAARVFDGARPCPVPRLLRAEADPHRLARLRLTESQEPAAGAVVVPAR